MNNYNPKDLKSTLIYIKKTFGEDIFTRPKELLAVFSDLAPSLKDERNMLERIAQIGTLTDFVFCTGKSEKERKRVISKARVQLTQSQYIMPEIVDSYLDILASVFEWEIKPRTIESQSDSRRKYLVVAIVASLLFIAGGVYLWGVNKSESRLVEENNSDETIEESNKEQVAEKETIESSEKEKTEGTSDAKDEVTGKSTGTEAEGSKISDQYTLPTAVPDDYYYYNGHTYAFYDASRYGFTTYDEVSAFCHEQGGHLAVINDRKENSYLYNLMKENYTITVFFGYTDKDQEGTWVWDGDESEYENWTRSGDWELPDNGESWGGGEWKNGGEDYAEYNYDRETNWGAPNDTTWNDAAFMENTTIFFCEWDYDISEVERAY